ncbi:MAG: 2-dehydropantoate 2-reductase [Rhodobiaceae bacterium]|nr:2-dehydropantoate 2-reductase [Rhodobiaceae bacterium]MCC0049698.1 2-dehydropantoate 2-reductase [Rhodobiaceae bacterium]
MKIATVATGGIGGYLAVRLTEAGHQVATIARGAHLDAIRKNGLKLEAHDGDHLVAPWIATDDTSEVGAVDAIIFGVKCGGLDAAANLCKPMLGDNTIVIPFLNGVEASDRLARILPEKNVGNGVAFISTTISAPGVISQTGEFNKFVFAERDSRPSTRIDALREAIDAAGSNAPPTDDIERELWSKFVLFSAVSGVTAAARCTIGDIMASDVLGDTFRAIIAETAALGRARGVALPGSIEADTWAFAQGLPAPMRASTAVDLEHGFSLEVDWISGAVARLSEEAGLPAPVNATIHAVLSPFKNGRG